ncbi:MAG TPA: HAD family hydrolase [Chitinophagaceae bacterium]|nr:HAD family hydrolase [Chitinophagaceae bacterium]
MNRRIAFFDFDGTLTTKDTLLEFIRFYKGSLWFYVGFLVYSPFLVAYKLKIIPNYVAKQKVLEFFFKGESIENFQKQCALFSQKILPGLIRPKAMKELELLKSSNSTIVIVSASAENWIKDWADKNGLQLLGTKLATDGKRITGKIDGKNCYGNEKVCRIRQHYELSAYNEIFCYGDSAGDKEMLELGTFSFYKPFR